MLSSSILIPARTRPSDSTSPLVNFSRRRENHILSRPISQDSHHCSPTDCLLNKFPLLIRDFPPILFLLVHSPEFISRASIRSMPSSSSPTIHPDVFDILGCGFGPANLGIAVALVDKWSSDNVLYCAYFILPLSTQLNPLFFMLRLNILGELFSSRSTQSSGGIQGCSFLALECK